jgi:hypothetical protein
LEEIEREAADGEVGADEGRGWELDEGAAGKGRDKEREERGRVGAGQGKW